jgi:hypothetical protein
VKKVAAIVAVAYGIALSLAASGQQVLGSSPPQSRVGKDPNCTGVSSWPASMAFSHLRNAGLTNFDGVDFAKTKVVRLASEQIGKDLYRQLHDITFTEKSGAVIEVITMNDASHEECSMSGVDVFVVARHLGRRSVVAAP